MCANKNKNKNLNISTLLNIFHKNSSNLVFCMYSRNQDGWKHVSKFDSSPNFRFMK